MEIVLIKSCFLYSIHAPHQRFTATSRCSTPIVLQDLDRQHLLQEQHHAQQPAAQAQMSKSGWGFWRKSLAAAAPWTSASPLVPRKRRSAQPFARPAQRQRHHPFVLLWIAAQRTFQSSAERFRPSALTQVAPGHRESIRARHTATLRISWSSLWFWSAATRKKGEKEAHDGSVNVWWPPCVHFL